MPMSSKRQGRGGNTARSGQSIIEYMLISVSVVAAILLVRWFLAGRAAGAMLNAINQIPN